MRYGDLISPNILP